MDHQQLSLSENLQEEGKEERKPVLIPNESDAVLGELSSKNVSNLPSICSGQDSGVSSVEGSSQCQALPIKGSKFSPYSTSTPKKAVQFLEDLKEYKILPSQMILDDPLLSSIDEPGGGVTDEEVKSLTSDDESEISISRQWNTQIRADVTAAVKNCPLISMPLTNFSSKSNLKKSHSFSGVSKCDTSHLDLHSVKKNLFDIPVSPKLKSRVRQRLYSLVNSIDGYDGKVSTENEVERICYCKMSDSETMTTSSKPMVSLCKSHCQKCNTVSSNALTQLTLDDILKSNASNNLLNRSSHSIDTSQKFGNITSTILESQLQTLYLHQEQLCKEKIKFALQKKEEELDAIIPLYRDKLKHMIQVLEEMDIKLKNTEREKIQEKEYFMKKIESMNESHRESLALLRLEYEKKIHETEAAVASVRLDVTRSCDKKLCEIMKFYKERTDATENEHQDHVLELNSKISKLQESQLLLQEKLEKLQSISSREKYEMTSSLRILEKQLSDTLTENAEIKQQKTQLETKVKEQQKNMCSVNVLEKEVSLLRAQLHDSRSKFEMEKQNYWLFAQKHSNELVEIKEKHEREMINHKLLMERERSIAVSQAVANREEETRTLLKVIESRYQELLNNSHVHFKAQIEEYRKAVRILKQKIKNMEEGHAT